MPTSWIVIGVKLPDTGDYWSCGGRDFGEGFLCFDVMCYDVIIWHGIERSGYEKTN
jgi:hypothetical protein